MVCSVYYYSWSFHIDKNFQTISKNAKRQSRMNRCLFAAKVLSSHRHRVQLIPTRSLFFLNQIPFISQFFPQRSTTPPIRAKKKRKNNHRSRRRQHDPDSSEGILQYDITNFINTYGLSNTMIPEDTIRHYLNFSNFKTVEELEILELNSNGHGMAILPSDHDPSNSQTIVFVPFVIKGDVIRARIGVHHEQYAEGHLLEILRSGPQRRNELIKCGHFAQCSGCQLQMMPYQDQLKFKKRVVETAYSKHGFDIARLPIGDTVASPLEYGYRTKLTPHFNSNRDNIIIGFEKSGIGKGMFNVEECAIAKPVIANAFTQDRHKLEDIVRRYKKSGTILLRDKSIDNKLEYTSDHKEIISQKISEFVFQFPAGEFFQNNNSILPSLIEDISNHLKNVKIKTLVDTYCGSGFIGISLSKDIKELIGIEISAGNLQMASTNAELNGVISSRFILGSSEEIFKDLSHLNPQETCIVLDPSRKGSSHSYLSQLSKFRPKLIVYVSCNVFTQARDLSFFLNSTENGSNYTINTIKGYDLFPQTKHVESLAVLELCT